MKIMLRSAEVWIKPWNVPLLSCFPTNIDYFQSSFSSITFIFASHIQSNNLPMFCLSASWTKIYVSILSDLSTMCRNTHILTKIKCQRHPFNRTRCPKYCDKASYLWVYENVNKCMGHPVPGTHLNKQIWSTHLKIFFLGGRRTILMWTHWTPWTISGVLVSYTERFGGSYIKISFILFISTQVCLYSGQNLNLTTPTKLWLQYKGLGSCLR